MTVSDVSTEAKNVLGRCDTSYLYRRLSDAVRLANAQGKFDWNMGQMELCVYDGFVTLPADVATVLAVNNSGYPTVLRDQWFQYNINSGGNGEFTPWGYTDEVGQFPTFRDPSAPVKLVAQVENSSDSNIALRVFGWDSAGKRIYTAGPNSTLEDGFLVPCVYGFPAVHPDVANIARIERIQKPVTTGFIKLIAVDATTLASHTTIGYYLPWETNPTYRRVRVPSESWLRIKYRKKDIEVRGEADWINIENREALLLLLKAVKLRLDGQLETAKGYEIEGMRLLSNDAESLRPPSLDAPQIIFNEYPHDHDRLIY